MSCAGGPRSFALLKLDMSLGTNVAALVAAEHPIRTVTIFQPSTAEVMREIAVDLQVRMLLPVLCFESLMRPSFLSAGRKECRGNLRHLRQS